MITAEGGVICKNCQLLLLSILIIITKLNVSAAAACDKSRSIFEGETYGEITHLDQKSQNSNYTQDSHCEFLIKASNSSQFIHLSFQYLKTECSYDYIFVYDGNSYKSRLIGTYSGQTDPEDITAYSGFMLILLFSDTNYVLEGFKAFFSVTNCYKNCSNHGVCTNHSCFCNADWTGTDCGVKVCNCGEDEKRGSCKNRRCECTSIDDQSQWSGQTCSLNKYNPPSSQWHWLTNSSNSFTKRAGHIAIYHELSDSLFVFGGYDLNNVLSSLEIFRFNTSAWEDTNGNELIQQDEAFLGDSRKTQFFNQNNNIRNKFWFKAVLMTQAKFQQNSTNSKTIELEPSPRFGHAACLIENTIVVYGGHLSNGKLSNELWLYNITQKQWRIIAKSSKLSPPKLTRHTLTYVESNKNIYLFGGALENGQFSSRMFRINIKEDEQWEEVFARSGKSFDYKIVAHTTNYHKDSHSLIVFGGITASSPRLSKLTDKMFSFNIENQHWTEIFYPKTVLSPKERAFHTTTVAGKYLVVFGGYVIRKEICFDNQLYLYNLKCHVWINLAALGSNRSIYPKKQGVFAHAAVLRGENTLLILGGYHGNINNDLLAFTLHDMMISSKTTIGSDKCMNYKNSHECASNPDCGFCSSDNSCYGRTTSNCFTNLQTTRCPGICASLKDCKSCLIHGNSHHETELPTEECSWCVQDAICQKKNDYKPCGESDVVEKMDSQWWGRKGIKIKDSNQCLKEDRPPGLFFLKFYHPFDWSFPDYLALVNSTSIDFGNIVSPVESSQNVDIVVRLSGFLRFPHESYKDLVRVCGSYAKVLLKTSVRNEATTVIANFTAEQKQCVNFFLEDQRVMIDLQAKRRLKTYILQQQYQSKVNMQNNATKAFTFEFLEPYSDGTNCKKYSNCMLCLSDNKCAWCDLTSVCLSRDIDETSLCSEKSHWRYLILHPQQCESCSDHLTCRDCTNYMKNCEWLVEETRCVRKGRSNGLSVAAECPTECSERTNCSNCLTEKGKCVWCEDTEECFSFSVYTSKFQFGSCREWTDQSISPPLLGSSNSHHQCKSCSALTNCTECLKTLSCGWCFYKDNLSIQGACVKGDFNSSLIDCKVSLNTTAATLYKYDFCPECGLGLSSRHNCHLNALCASKQGKLTCECKNGFKGDGKYKCERTCEEICKFGRCSEFDNYKCICDLGYTGKDCSVDCGCNFHSTCKNGFGKCDECLDYTFTEGEHCDKCIKGSYGNASNCFPCHCNQHGDETKDVCNPQSGKCFCLENTRGNNCEFCERDFYGEPRNGGSCYMKCQSRTMLNITQITKSIGIGSFESIDDASECLWMLKLNESYAEGSLIHLEIEKRDMNVSCYNNAIYVYNQIFDTSYNVMQKKILSVICSDSDFPKIVEESRTGQMSIYFQRSVNNEGFNAKISVHSCKLGTCTDPFVCDESNHCVCPPLTTGTRCEIEICPMNCSESMNQGLCDKTNKRCICKAGFGGSDCLRVLKKTSIDVTELFSIQSNTGSLIHLKKTLPRFGHTVNADRRGFLWMFGGYSFSNGALNDIRQFDTKTFSWMQVTVDGAEAKMPVGRYFHASAMSKQHSIYTYGGLSHELELLNDFWMFKIQEQRWVEIVTENIESPRPKFLCGHSLTLVKIGEIESLMLIGGYTNQSNQNIAWEYHFDRSWKIINVEGSGPTAVFGHSAVFHAASQALYIFGGFQMVNNKLKVSKRLYSLSSHNDGQVWRWSTIPVFNDLNRPEEHLPRSRYLHSAIGFAQYMIIFGGKTQPHDSSDNLNAYIYKCNSYVPVRLTESVENIGQRLEKNMYTQVVPFESDSDMNEFFIVGGIDTKFSISKISIPSDICQMFSSSKFICRQQMGCSFGQISTVNNTKTFCFSSNQKENPKNEVASSFNHGKVCNSLLLTQRNCSSFETCDDCQSIWPQETVSSCKWFDKKCLSNVFEGSSISSNYEPCFETNCSSLDCELCSSKPGCTWSKISESCIVSVEKKDENIECPKKCSSFNSCNSCLSALTSEKGYNECLWSKMRSKCFSPAFKSFICAGGACGGLLLRKNETFLCPVDCKSHTMCSSCLQNVQCGWCSTGNESGNGVCVDGNLNRPEGNEELITTKICNAKYESLKNLTISSNLDWNFLTCPKENECLNDHHTCNKVTEKCIDLQNGFLCECADGYKKSEETEGCWPVCTQGCVHGHCTAPGFCECDFGFVGNNCSIKCSCNGHSHCAGADKLDECLKCTNNTIGKQCEKCEKFYVGDPSNDGKCLPCLLYCNGHTDSCVSELDASMKNLTRDELSDILTEGGSSAVCLNCGNFTSGVRCESCLEGTFRGTSNLNEVCRKCECNGHGNLCDPVTGEKCNCANNTESDNTCPAKLDKNSIYHCWMSQCSKCKESYSGHPKHGHSCFKHITIDSKMCLESAKSIDECKVEAVPLKSGKTVFFVVQPRFMNVDIRIILDVTAGELDFFMTTNDDSFVVLTNQSNSFHEILLDSKYQWIQEYSENSDYSENLNITPLVTSSKKSFENVSIPHGFTDNRGSSDCRSHGKFYVLDKNAQSLTTFIKLTRCNTLLRVFELKNRLVVTLPQNIHNLSGTRFFIALRAANHATATGLIFFRQDQLHIDLFVFFSVFFSCFFLFLSAVVVIWKVKQAADLRRARRRHVVEMLNMAQRPYSDVIFDSTRENLQSQKTVSKVMKKDINYMPIALETCRDHQAAVSTIFVRLPGENVCLGSSLIVSPKNIFVFLNKPARVSQQIV